MAGYVHVMDVETSEGQLAPGIGVFPEPDFWSLRDDEGNAFPIHVNCRPDTRRECGEGDWVFYVPKQGSLPNAVETGRPVLGLMKIEGTVDYDDIQEQDRFHDSWVLRYRLDLAHPEHLPRYFVVDEDLSSRQKSQKYYWANLRLTNHLVGEPQNSAWFGADTVSLQDAANQADLDVDIEYNRSAFELEGSTAGKLAEVLLDSAEPAKGVPAHAAPPEQDGEMTDTTHIGCGQVVDWDVDHESN